VKLEVEANSPSVRAIVDSNAKRDSFKRSGRSDAVSEIPIRRRMRDARMSAAESNSDKFEKRKGLCPHGSKRGSLSW
jgi:hypothetical protein